MVVREEMGEKEEVCGKRHEILGVVVRARQSLCRQWVQVMGSGRSKKEGGGSPGRVAVEEADSPGLNRGVTMVVVIGKVRENAGSHCWLTGEERVKGRAR